MLRAAAKNHARVAVLVDPADYARALAELRAGGVSEATRRRLAAKAFGHTAQYDAMVSGVAAPPAGRSRVPGSRSRPDSARGRTCATARTRTSRRRSTPTRWPPAHRSRPHGSCRARSSRTTTSPTPTPRSNACASSMAPACVIVKHANPCGVAVAATPARRLPARLRAGHDLGLRRHHRLQPPARRRNRCRHPRTAVRRSDRGAVVRAGGAGGTRRASRTSACWRPGRSTAPAPAAVELKSVAGGLLAQIAGRRRDLRARTSRP